MAAAMDRHYESAANERDALYARVRELEIALEPCIPIVEAHAKYNAERHGLSEPAVMHVEIIDQARRALAT